MTTSTVNNLLFLVVGDDKNITVIFSILFFMTRFFHSNFLILIPVLFLFGKTKPELFLVIGRNSKRLFLSENNAMRIVIIL